MDHKKLLRDLNKAIEFNNLELCRVIISIGGEKFLQNDKVKILKPSIRVAIKTRNTKAIMLLLKSGLSIRFIKEMKVAEAINEYFRGGNGQEVLKYIQEIEDVLS